MSRSYKKTPWAGDKKGKFKKRCANSKVRMFLKDFNHKLQNNSYKKVYESWDICDYSWMETWEEYKKNIEESKLRFPHLYPPNKKINWKEKYRQWYKMYKMK